MSKALSWDDVCLIPQFSEVPSRSVPDTSCKIGHMHDRKTPILVANMDTITGPEMAIAAWKAGAIGTLHRFCTIEQNVKDLLAVREAGALCYVTVGVNDWEERGMALYENCARHWIVDIAHGHSALMREAVKGIRKKFGPYLELMAGNVATPEAVADLADWGVDIVKVGIGGGSICKTRIVTGHGVPMFSSVMECAAMADLKKVKIVADGGIRYSGDIVKAFVAGADYVMIGSLLAGSNETPGELTHEYFQKPPATPGGDEVWKVKLFKTYRGMASAEAQRERFWGSNELSVAPEGVSTKVEIKGNAADILHELTMGLKTGMSYCNALKLDEIHSKAVWREQTHSGFVEGTPHILRSH